MDSDEQINLEGFSSPKAYAESMAKRYNQMRAAFPLAGNTELFHLILENRYKLLGKNISISERRKIVDNADDSLALLTLNTLLTEQEGVIDHFKNDQQIFNAAMTEICEIISKETKGSDDSKKESCNDLGWKVLNEVF